MYRGSSLACPACRGTLTYTNASLPVHGCHSCGGLWLGPDAAIHVLQGRGGALATEVVDADRRTATAPAASPSVVPNHEPRRCPSCELEMAPLTVGAVRVDSCPAHGTWFDHLEVTQVTRELLARSKHARRREEEAGLPSLQDFVHDTKALAVGAVKIPLQLFEWMVEWVERTEHPRGCRCSECVDRRYEDRQR